VIKTVAGHEIVIDDDGGKVTITDSNDNKITLDSNGLKLERGGGNVEITDGKVSANDGGLEVQ